MFGTLIADSKISTYIDNKLKPKKVSSFIPNFFKVHFFHLDKVFLRIRRKYRFLNTQQDQFC